MVLVASAGTPADAKTCAGTIACACGDTVIEDTVLDADLGVCDTTALRIRTGVTLDCAGFTITGSDLSNAKFGIELDGAVGAQVLNCRVTKFRRGIRVHGGGENVLRGNFVHDNRDEGIHVGGSHRNKIVGNEISYNKRENLYLLESNGNLVKGNLAKRSGAAAIFVKHSSRNRFVRNRTEDTAVQLRGGSRRNVFEGNYLKGNGYMLEAFEEPDGWRHPSGNTMTADCIRKTDFCFRFFGAFDNVATGTRVDDRCAPPENNPVTSEVGGRIRRRDPP